MRDWSDFGIAEIALADLVAAGVVDLDLALADFFVVDLVSAEFVLVLAEFVLVLADLAAAAGIAYFDFVVAGLVVVALAAVDFVLVGLGLPDHDFDLVGLSVVSAAPCCHLLGPAAFCAH